MDKKYYLAIENKPNSYFPINLSDLKIASNMTTTKLEELDNFTLRFTKTEIIDAIKTANLLEVDNNMALVIIYYEKNDVRKMNALTKEVSFDMWQYLKDTLENKTIQNKIHNFLQNKISKETLDNLKEVKDYPELITIISKLPYEIERKLYFYLYENK